jgi:hypothetical protein
MKKTILFLDAGTRSTLSMLRSIGQLDQYRMYTAGMSSWSFCRFSRYCTRHFVYEDPQRNHRLFIESLRHIITQLKPDYICPTTDKTLYSIYSSSLYDDIKEILIAPEKELYLTTFDKQKMNQIADLCQIKRIEDILSDDISFPMVVKPRQSLFIQNDQMYSGFRRIVSNEGERSQALKEFQGYDASPLIQPMIKGNGYGVFAAAKDGKIFAVFAHERIREIPPGGGVSTMRRSIKVHPYLLDATEKLVRSLNWTGILMVEFKGRPRRIPILWKSMGDHGDLWILRFAKGLIFPK